MTYPMKLKSSKYVFHIFIQIITDVKKEYDFATGFISKTELLIEAVMKFNYTI